MRARQAPSLVQGSLEQISPWIPADVTAFDLLFEPPLCALG